MKQLVLSTALVFCSTLMVAQNKVGSSSTKTPAGATVTVKDGSTVTKSGETLTTSTSDYNVVQVTNGLLQMTDCSLSKTGDYSSSYSSDDTSFYGTNSAVYASGVSSVVEMEGGQIVTDAKGANAVFATNGATITISDVSIDNTSSVSRGLHCTGGGIINATNVDITTRSETSSAVATDRGGGFVTVNGGTITAKGKKSSVIYSTGTISVDGIVGCSEKGPLTTVEGSNSVVIRNSDMTSMSDARGILLHQSTSGDAEGTNPVCTVSNSTLTTTDSSAPLCFVTNAAATLTLTDVNLNIASGKLMSVEYYKRGNGSKGSLVLRTTQDQWEYVGSVDADEVNNVSVTVGEHVTWYGAADSDDNAVSSVVEVEEGGVWSLIGDSYVSTLTNNGTIYTNGYSLVCATKSGSGTIDSPAGIGTVSAQQNDSVTYTLDGRRATAGYHGIVIEKGKKKMRN